MFRPDTDWLAKWAGYTPTRRFLRDHRRQLEWSFAEADRRVDALAAWLHEQHRIGAGDRVAILSVNRSETIFLFLACMRLGAVLVPLNFRLTAPEIDALMANCRPRLTIHGPELATTFAGLSTSSVDQLASMQEIEPFLTQPTGSERGPAREPADLDQPVMVLYTSGTTGTPKGALITHRMLLWNAINTGLRLDLCSSDHTQSYAPFFHTGGWNVLFTPFLLHGASHTVLEGFDPDLVLSLMQSEGTTLLFGVPTMLQMMAGAPGFQAANLGHVRYAIVGGAPMPLPLIDEWHAKGVRIRQGYGLTEVGPNCFSLHEDEAIRKRGSIGLPNHFIDARIVDATGQDCESGAVGELWLRSEVVTPGYWNRPEDTAAAMTNGWFRTGDLVRRDDEGFYYVVDRKKNMFISGGENVYPAEVERCLAEHEAVEEVAVIGVEDERWGEVGHAFVVCKREHRLEWKDLIEFCRPRLARYKTPRHLTLLSEMPRNDAGKVDAARLRSLRHSSEEESE